MEARPLIFALIVAFSGFAFGQGTVRVDNSTGEVNYPSNFVTANSGTGANQFANGAATQTALDAKQNASALGDAAFKNTGTAAGTVAAGNDSRFTETVNRNVPAGSVIVFEGDSIMAGYGITSGQRMSAIMLADPRFSGVTASYNQAASSNDLADVVSQYSTQIYPYRPAASGASKAFLFLEIGTNDIYFNNYASASAFMADFLDYVEQAQDDGFTVIVYTIAPRIEGSAFNQTQETLRQGINKLIRNSEVPDYIIDFAARLPDASDTAYYQDGVHPTAVGNYVLAQLMADVVGSNLSANDLAALAFIQNSDVRFQAGQSIRSGQWIDFKGGVTGQYSNSARIGRDIIGGSSILQIFGAGTNVATDLKIEMYHRGGLAMGGPVSQIDGRVRFTSSPSLSDDGVNAVQVGGTIRITGSNTALTGVTLLSGTGSPEGVFSAPVGSLYFRQDGGAGTSLYIKESGTGNTGWIAK